MRKWQNLSDEERKKYLAESGFCPHCEIRWTSKYHPGCEYFDAINSQ